MNEPNNRRLDLRHLFVVLSCALCFLSFGACHSPTRERQSSHAALSMLQTGGTDQVLWASDSSGDALESAPGGVVVSMTESERREFFEARQPVYREVAEYRPLPPIPVMVYYRDQRGRRVFPFFRTLTHAGIGAIIGHQFGGHSGRGALIGGTLGLFRDGWDW